MADERVLSRDGKTEALPLVDVTETRSYMGRTQDDVTCPWCGATTSTYRWSRAGSGKRCSGCDAILGSSLAFRKVRE